MIDKVPDIALEKKETNIELDQVGMDNIGFYVNVLDENDNEIKIPAIADMSIDFSNNSGRGIHMSRLYITAQEELDKNILNVNLINKILKKFIETHKKVSKNSYFKIKFKYPLKRKSLLSNYKAWRLYDIELNGSIKNGDFDFYQVFSIKYSSTCPCSAALSRQIIHDNFDNDFKKENINKNDILKWIISDKNISATPHGQRSNLLVKLRFLNNTPVKISSTIKSLEEKISTPVQAIVKREDEQEFSKLNGQNLIFAEDAARKIKNYISNRKDISDFYIKVSHYESLHAHNAVAIASKYGYFK